MCVYVQISPSYKNTGHNGLGPILITFKKKLISVEYGASLVAQIVKNLPATQERRVWSLGQEDPLEKGMATHSIILAWIALQCCVGFCCKQCESAISIPISVLFLNFLPV